jgi:hypothetical protein
MCVQLLRILSENWLFGLIVNMILWKESTCLYRCGIPYFKRCGRLCWFLTDIFTGRDIK